ncbi:zinc finger protein 638 isoform X2 [Aythya fuligula]|uniref:Zinc finger protein 638 isoform X2 n=1 Tax=Aythya fuligula TaxID=219594 RepID=A0A6J3CYF1_AYTFU|nr:zinc finger protein 638 isoform X2 [Aythya fuligula]
MFSPRGALPQRPRGPNPAGAKPPGSFRGGGAAGLQRKPAPGTPPGAPQRFSGQDSFQWTGSQRINVRVTLHRADPRQVKVKTNLHQEQKGEARSSRWDNNPCSAGAAAQKPPPPARIPEQNANAQSRYTPESASSILASFGLSNEDLEELSRYPDDQLTPENMPLILREIRIRKMGHSLSGLHPPSRGEETLGGTSGAAVKGKVIDYGHASKYGYTEDPLEVRAYNSEVLNEDPLESRVYNPETPAPESREDFQREQNVPMGVPPPGVPCNPVFPVQDLLKPPAFQNDSSTSRSFFPTEAAGKVSGLCSAPAGGLPVVKPVSQPAVPPVMPPMLPPPMLPPLAQPLLPPVMPPLVQPPVPQHVMPPMAQPPFSAELLAAVGQHERIQHEAGSSQPAAQSGSVAGQKAFQPQPEGPIKSPFGIVKASWLPVFLQSDAQKIKRLPTPSMMNDYYATSPRIFPHMCSLCNIECTHMKDWILHQNTPSHIESCRQLRQQYPDWNPESRSSKRNAGDRKENQTPKRRSNSASPSPRRSRVAGSSYVLRRSRSRSRSPGRFRPTRPRSRSPRQMRRLSPRHRSRSPQRSRNLLRTSPRPPRSSSNDWSRRATRSQGKMPGNMKKPLKSVSPKAAKKDTLSLPGSSSSPESDDSPQDKEVEEDEEDLPAGTSGPRPSPYNRLLREELLNCGTVLQISDLPDDGFSDQDIKKIVQPFGKVSDLIVLRSRNEAYLEMNYKEAVIAAVKYGETVPVLVNGKRVKISVAEKPKASPGQAKMNIKKKTRIVKKVAPSTKKHQNTTTKTTKSVTGKKEKTKKSVVTKDSKIKKTSTTAANSVENKSEDLQISTEAEMDTGEVELSDPKSVTEGDKVTEAVKVVETPTKGIDNPASLLEKLAEMPQVAAVDLDEIKEPLTDQEAAVATVKSEESTEPISKEPDDICVVLISNLPEKGYSVEEVSNLAKPFGGLRDVLILSSHKKAYLEINRKSADSMVKFYTCFPMSLDGNQLCINMVPQYKTIKDEESIFTAIIKESDPKVNTEAIHHQFVHLGNLPDDGYREFEVVCVGLRFGKVDHYVVLKNKNKAILQLESPKAARSMYCFLKQYPYKMGEHTLSCMLSPNGEYAEAEAIKKDVKKEEPSKGSSGLKKYPEGSGVVQTAAANPPVEPSVAKKEPISISNVKDEMSAVQIEPSESHLGRAIREAAPRLAETPVEKEEAELGVASIDSADAELLGAKAEELLPPSSLEREEVLADHTKVELGKSAVLSASEKEVKARAEEPSAAATEPPGESCDVGKVEDVPSGSALKLPGEKKAGAVVPEAVPPALDAASAEMVSPLVTQTSKKLDALEKNHVSDAVNTECEKPVTQITEKKPTLQTGVAVVERKVDAAGAATERNPEESALKAGTAAEETPEKLWGKTGAEPEKKLEKSVTKVGASVENAEKNVNEKNEGSLSKAPQNKGTGPAKADETCKALPASPSLSVKEASSVGKAILKAVLSLPDVSKARVPVRRNEPSLCKGEEQKAASKPEPRGQAVAEKKISPKEGGAPRAGSNRASLGDGSGKPKVSRSSVVDGKGGNGRNSSQQDKDSRVESRASSKQSQEGESRSSSTKKDNSSNKASVGGNAARPSKSGSSSSVKQKEEEELFPFNLDEFVTVDEVVEESESPVKTRRNPPRGKRKDGAKNNSSSEPSSKRRKGKSSAARIAESELSFVTLDEIGEEEDVAAQLVGVANLEALSDPQGLVVVDEVIEEEELMVEAVKDPQSLVTLDEISEQEEPGSHKDVPGSVFEEQDLKTEPLVTVDEIGEVEELPLNEPTGLSIEDVLKQKEEDKGPAEDSGEFVTSQVPDDPSALVTVDEIQEDNEDNPLVTLDEVNEDEDDFLADFNRLKEELNFVTVDEVGEEDEEEENTFPGKNLNEDEDDEDIVAVAGPEEEIAAIAGPEEEDIVAVAGPEEMEILGDMSPEDEDIIAISKSKDQLGSGRKEPEPKQKKTVALDASKVQSAPKDLDYLVPKAGFFCQICSLFYADETSVKNHCKTPLHQQNMEKFMAKQKDEGNSGEERSSR